MLFRSAFADMMMLSADFAPEEAHVLNLSIKNDMGMVMELSERICEFCCKYSQDMEKIQKLSLCIEEMAGNIVQHGFRDNREHSIDIRIVITSDKFVFRMRDDGVAFNPICYADEKNTEGTMGIRIIQKIAQDMSYSNAVGLNNLTITL